MPKLSQKLKRVTKLLKYVFPDQTYERRRQMAISNFKVGKGDKGDFFDAKKNVKGVKDES